ncbi:MFS transporter [Paeniglutamicibacter sp. NPDC091659]|uniref:MFS transporter n=1 Tax=Paeniglutamicibacter sp. NPDC091659 TaxID=3364389 RepID=UPI0038129F21
MTTSLATSRLKSATDRGTYTYIAVYSAVLYMTLLIAPIIAAKLVNQFGLSSTEVGGLLSLELGAFSLATVPAYLWLRRVNLVTATRVFTLIAVAGNVASGFVDSYGLLVASRIVTSLAAGSITVIILTLSSKTANPSRAYGLFVTAQLVMGAIILAVFPAVFANANVSAVYWSMAGLALCCLLFSGRIDGNALRAGSKAADPGSASARAVRVPKLKAGLGLAAVILFYISLSGVWSFMAQIAGGANISLSTTSLILALATVPGIASSMLATFLGDHPKRALFLVLGYVGLAASVAMLVGLTGAVQFALAAILFKFTWTFILPYLLSSISDLDASGQLMNTTNLMIGTGFAVGPLLGGILIEATGGFTAMLTVACVGALVSMLFAASIQRRTPRVLAG